MKKIILISVLVILSFMLMAQNYEKKNIVIKDKGKDITLSVYTAKEDVWYFQHTSDFNVEEEPKLINKSSSIVSNADAVNGGVIIKDTEVEIWQELDNVKYKVPEDIQKIKDEKLKVKAK